MAERRQQILDAAQGMAEADGWTAVTSRRLADAIGYTQPVLYGHFPGGKNEIMRTVALAGFAELAAATRAAMEGKTGPQRPTRHEPAGTRRPDAPGAPAPPDSRTRGPLRQLKKPGRIPAGGGTAATGRPACSNVPRGRWRAVLLARICARCDSDHLGQADHE